MTRRLLGVIVSLFVMFASIYQFWWQPQASTDKPREVPNGSLNSVRNVNAAAFCKQHSIAHFQMGTCRDMDAAAAAFQHVIRSAVHRLC